MLPLDFRDPILGRGILEVGGRALSSSEAVAEESWEDVRDGECWGSISLMDGMASEVVVMIVCLW